MIEQHDATELQAVADTTWTAPDYQVVETSLEVTAYFTGEF